MRKILLKFVLASQIIGLLIFGGLMTVKAQEAQEEKLLFTPPEYKNVVVQKNIEYRRAGDKSLKFDFYRLPGREKSGALPVVIFMNGFGSADLKDSALQTEWAKLCAASGLAAVTFQSHYDGLPGNLPLVVESVSEDFDSLIAYLRANREKLGLDVETVIVHASSGNVLAGLPLVMDKKRSFIKAAVIYYGSADIKEFRLDLPVFFVRAGLDQPNLMRQIDVLLGRALAANAPFEIVNHPGGQHPFEISGEADRMSSDIISRTVEFMHRAVSPEVQASIRASIDKATAGAALLTENWTEAVKGYAALVAKKPQDNELHRRYADSLYGAKEYAKAVKEYEQALALGNWRRRDIAYPAAAASVKAGDPESALKWINILVNTPFNRASLLTDPNFEAIRNDQKFRALVENSGR